MRFAIAMVSFGALMTLWCAAGLAFTDDPVFAFLAVWNALSTCGLLHVFRRELTGAA